MHHTTVPMMQKGGQTLKAGRKGNCCKHPSYHMNAEQDELKRFVRFWSSKSGDNQTSLDEYISRMKDNHSGLGH